MMISSLQKAVRVISAHDSLLATMSFSQSGEKLATASEKVCITFNSNMLWGKSQTSYIPFLFMLYSTHIYTQSYMKSETIIT